MIMMGATRRLGIVTTLRRDKGKVCCEMILEGGLP